MKSRTLKALSLAAIVTSSILLSSCARTNNGNDPYESFNRKAFAFNKAVDNVVYKPLAIAYTHVLPNVAQKGVNNFFNNIGEVQNVINDVLQAKFAFAVSDTWRFIFNTTLGFGGLVDFASHRQGLPKHYEDFGMTLAQWGNYRPSAYFQIPFVGPSTFRMAFGIPIDAFAFSIWPWIKPTSRAWTLYGLYLVTLRANALPADPLIQQSFDPYTFVRDAYMQRRHALLKKNQLSFKQYLAQVKNPDAADNQSADEAAHNAPPPQFDIDAPTT